MCDGSDKRAIFQIGCDRIILREYTPDDLGAIYAITLQPAIREFLPDWVSTREQREIWLNKYEIPENQAFFSSMPHVGGNILRLAIVLKQTGKVIGWIVSGMKEELPEPNREIGYGISCEHTGKGYATEAARAVIGFFFDKTDVRVINAIARTDNAPSNRVILKAGLRYVEDLSIDGHEYHYYRIEDAYNYPSYFRA